MNRDGTGLYTCKEWHKTQSLWNNTTTEHKEGEQLEDRRSVAASSCNSGDETDQMVQSPIFLMMNFFLWHYMCQSMCVPSLYFVDFVSFRWRCDPTGARASSFTRFLDDTQRRNTVGRTPLDSWSVCRRELYLTTHNTQQTDIHAPGEIRTHNLSRRAAVDLLLRPRGHWDRLFPTLVVGKKKPNLFTWRRSPYRAVKILCLRYMKPIS